MAISAVAGAFGSSKAAKSQKSAIGEAMRLLQEYSDQQLGLVDQINAQQQDRLTEARANTQGAVRGAADSYNTKVDEALGALNTGYSGAVDATNSGYGQARADLQPFADTGASALDRLYKTYITGENSYQATDPGYAFRLAEGTKALERSAAARGGLYSGATGKALTNYAQGAASQEFQNSYSRLLPLANMGVQTAGQLSNLSVGQGNALANLATGQGKDVAGIRQNQGSFLGDLAMKDGMLDYSINSDRNALDASYGARKSSILQNLASGLAGGNMQYGAASAAGTMGRANSIGGLGSSLMNVAGFFGGGNSGLNQAAKSW